MTRGHKSSERKACYHAFLAGFCLAGLGIYMQSDLSALAALVIAVCTPLMWYAGNRSYVKGKIGEDNV